MHRLQFINIARVWRAIFDALSSLRAELLLRDGELSSLRISLRTLLIAMTLVAVGLGAVIYAVK